jgi:hypothetical protein
MSGWALRIEHQPDGLRLRFPEPLATLDMTSETAAHLASLLAVEARHRMRGVVAGLSEPPTRPNSEIIRDSELCCTAQQSRPLCCDCEPCLNGDHDG